MHNRPKFDLYIPSLKRNYPIMELNTLQQKNLCKSIIVSDDVYATEFFITLKDIIQENIGDLINIDNLNIHDFLVLAIGLRAGSISSKLPLKITCNKCKCVHKYTVNLAELYVKLYGLYKKDIIVKYKDYQFKLGLPSLAKERDILYKLKDVSYNNDEPFKTAVFLNIDRYIKYIKKNNKIIKISNINKFYKNLPLDCVTLILKNMQTHFKFKYNIFDFNCTNMSTKCDQRLLKVITYKIENYYDILKLLFSDNIINLNKDLFYLQKIGVSFEYAEGLAPMERQLMWTFFKEIEAKKTQRKTSDLSFPLPMPTPTNNKIEVI